MPDTENVEEYKAALLAANKPNPEFYKKVKLPKKVTAYDNKAAANGIITLTGIKGISGGNEQ